MSLLVREFDTVFNELFGTSAQKYTDGVKYHTSKNENDYILEVPLPGSSKNDVEVSVEKDILKLSVKKNESRFSKEYNHMWYLAEDHNPEDVRASMENGILTVKVGRVKPQKKFVNVTVV